MALNPNATPSPIYAPIPLIDNGDPVAGGLSGASNKSAIALAERTENLRMLGIYAHDVAFNYTIGAYAQVSGSVYRAKTNNINKPPAANPNDWDACYMTASEIFKLLGNSSGSKPTKLSEYGISDGVTQAMMADAITAHEAKPDPHTQYVLKANQKLQSNNLGGYTSSATLSVADLGRATYYSSLTAGTLTLPVMTGQPSGSMVSIYCLDSGSCVVKGSGTQGVFAFGLKGATSVTLNQGDCVQLAWDGTNWIEVNGYQSKISSNGLSSYNTSTTLTTADLGRGTYYSSLTAGILTLPVMTGQPSGSMVSIYCLDSGSCVVKGSGTQGVFAFGLKGATSVTLNQGDCVQLAWDGTNWIEVNGYQSKISSNGLSSYNTSTTLTTADLGRGTYYSSLTAGILTLPVMTGQPSGSMVSIYCLDSGSCVVKGSGTQGVFAFGLKGATSVTLNQGDCVQLAWDGTNWVEMSGYQSKISSNGLNGYTTSASLTVADIGRATYYSSASDGTLTLPNMAGQAVGQIVSFYCMDTGSLILSRNGTQLIYALGVKGATSITLLTGDNIQLAWDGGNWVEVGGSGTTRTKFDKSRTLATTEWVSQQGVFLASQFVLSNHITLNAGHAGSRLTVSMTGAVVTLPLASTIPAGGSIIIGIGDPATSAFVNVQSGNNFEGSQPTSLLLLSGEQLMLTSDGGSTWLRTVDTRSKNSANLTKQGAASLAVGASLTNTFVFATRAPGTLLVFSNIICSGANANTVTLQNNTSINGTLAASEATSTGYASSSKTTLGSNQVVTISSVIKNNGTTTALGMTTELYYIFLAGV